jgi:hypothetical protein
LEWKKMQRCPAEITPSNVMRIYNSSTTLTKSHQGWFTTIRNEADQAEALAAFCALVRIASIRCLGARVGGRSDGPPLDSERPTKGITAAKAEIAAL